MLTSEKPVLLSGHARVQAARRGTTIEILDAMKRLDDPTTFRQVTLEDVAFARNT